MADASPPVDPQASSTAAETPAQAPAADKAASDVAAADAAVAPAAAAPNAATQAGGTAIPANDETLSEMAAEEAQELLDSISAGESGQSASQGGASAASAASADGPAESGDAAMEELLKQANFEDPAAPPPAPDAEPFQLPSFQQVMQDAQVSSIDLLRDVELNVKIELGRNRMLVEDVLKLGEGSVVELDKLAGDPVDVFVNDRLVARGEVLVLNDNFCVRVNEIVAGAKEEGL